MPSVQLLQVTDPHLYADPSREIYDTNSAESLRAVLAQALADGPRPDAVLVTGDVAEDSTAEAYARFRDTLATAGVPVLCLPGNHDAPGLMAALLDRDGFRFCGRVDLGRWRLVLLDTHVPGDPAGRLSDAELARLDAELAAAPDRPALIALHHPPRPVGSRWLDRYGLLNADALFAVLAKHPQVRGVVGGHVHQAFDQVHAGVRVLATPSTCAQFRPHVDTCEIDDRPPGFRRVGLEPDGGIVTTVGWLRDGHRAAQPRDARGPEGGAAE
jgi:Icc protein